MRTFPHLLSVVLLVLLIGTLPGCLAITPDEQAGRGIGQPERTLQNRDESGDMELAFFRAACTGGTEKARTA